jgi:hypothetical protein
MTRLDGKVVIITGGNGLIGKSLIDKLKLENAICINADLHNETLDDLSNVICDVTNVESIDNTINLVLKKFGNFNKDLKFYINKVFENMKTTPSKKSTTKKAAVVKKDTPVKKVASKKTVDEDDEEEEVKPAKKTAVKATKKTPQMPKYNSEALSDMPASAITFLQDDSKPANSAYDVTQILENRTRIDYNIDLKYSIPSDGKNHQVAIAKKNVSAEFEFYAAPKLDKDAFLLAKITNWEDLNLLPGYARIYFDGSFVGKTYINVNNNTDTLALNLGRDNSIDVIRKKL